MSLQKTISAAVLCLGLALVLPATAGAQANLNTSSFQGTVGFGLVGAELGLVTAGAFDALWAYLAFPAALGAGGAVAGYFLLDEPNSVEGSVAALVTGMALIIPSIVLTLVLAADDPADDLEEGETVSSGKAPRRGKRWAAAGVGLVRFSSGEFRLALPAVGVGPLEGSSFASQTPGAMGRSAGGAPGALVGTGVDRAPVLHVPVLSGAL